LPLLVLVIFGVVLIGCGPAAAPSVEEMVEETPAEEEAPAVEEETPEEVATEEAALAIQLVVWADELRAPIIEDLCTGLLAEYNIELVVQQMSFGDIRDQLAVAGPAGEGPDILVGAHDWLGQLVENGLVAPIDLGAHEADFFGPALEAFTYGGTLYGVPYATENIAFFCNPDVLALVDAEVPATWDDVTALAEDLEAATGGDVTAWTIQTNDPYHFNPLLTAFGGYIFGETETGYDPADIGIDNDGGIAAGQWLQAMAEAGHITGNVDYDVMHTLFYDGSVACIGTGPRALNGIRDSGVNYVIGPYPSEATEAAPFLGVQGFMVSAFSENQLVAQTVLLELVSTEEFMTALYEADPRPSAFLAVRDAIDDPDLAAFAAAGENGQPMPAIPEMSSVWEALGNNEELIITMAEDGETGMTTAAEQIRTIIAGE
jgi:arabinogalactan oligomer/maltooligosaccharide transport system substrate-binding protein